jgi:dTDP-glucose pyrophosphorylase
MKYLQLKSDTVLDDALRLLDANGNGFLPVIDEQNKLVGIITDGDVRRGILNKTLELDSIINRNPITANFGTSHLIIKRQLRELHRRHMPIIDETGKLVDVVVLDNFEFISKDNWVVIMVGGLGSRLGDLTKMIPKPMLEIGGKPILLGIIEHFKSQGFGKFVLCVNYKAEIIENYFKDGTWLGVKIEYTRETKRMGTAGALSLIDFEMEAPFFVVNGDVLTSINFEDFLDFHNVNNAVATMCVKSYVFDIPYACIDFNDNGDILALREKPSNEYFINTGMYILKPEILKKIPKNDYYDMPQLFDDLIEQAKECKAYRIDEYWLDLGRPEDLDKGQSDLKI